MCRGAGTSPRPRVRRRATWHRRRLRFACLPYEAFFSLDAILRTAGRMLFTHTRLLEWTASSELDGKSSWRAMWIGPVTAIAATLCLIAWNPVALVVAAPILLLWLASPAIAWWVSLPLGRREARLAPEQIAFLRTAARKTWGFFETFVGAEDHWLPPDNYQEHPVAVVAHRTSPTNMGLALLANLAAYDFGYLTAGALIERTDKALGTMRSLERHRGHFYNWYDTRSLKPLPPLYISSVDSGNLACHLLTLRPGLLALADAPIVAPQCFDDLRESPPATVRAARLVLERFVLEASAEPVARQCQAALDELARFRLPDDGAIPTLRELARLNDESGRRARERIGTLERLARECGELASMEYGFLVDKSRQLLAIGYNVSEHRRDASCYDLLASEARAASFVAIAQGELPQESWFALGRLLTGAGGEPALLSWSGSMFEYLMPLLVMPAYENTLLEHTCRAAVNRQIAYGSECGVPWGMSESGYNTVDAALNYQYRAFGVPGLGLKRGLTEDVVVAPYASALALMVAPEAACANLQRLAAAGLELSLIHI